MSKFLVTEEPRENDIAVVPPLKWAGGKRWFASNHRDLLPKKFNRYIEPFLGSGALFFSLTPEKAVLSDLNSELINLYQVIRDFPGELEKKMIEHQRLHNSEYYYKIRSMRPRSLVNKAARTLYLNRTCWNGLYRVNLNGDFNVPKGTKDSVVLATDDFSRLSGVLNLAQIVCQDFEVSLGVAERGDFAFIDPPYTVAHNNNGFVKYNQNLFKWEDQIRLRDAVSRAVERGVQVLVTNAAHHSVKLLYSNYEQFVVDRPGIISGSSSARGVYQELVVKNY